MDEHVKQKLNSSFQEKLRDQIEFDIFNIDIEMEHEDHIYCFYSTLYAEGGNRHYFDRDTPPEYDPPFIQCNSTSLVQVHKETGLVCYFDDEAGEIVKEGIETFKG